MVDQNNYQKVIQFYDQLKNQWADAEARRIEMYQHVSGKQMWKDKDRALLESQRRPVLQYNYELPILLYMTGSQLQSRSYMRAIPNGDGVTEEASRLMTKLMYWNFNRAYYEYENSKSYMHDLIGGLGWLHDWHDYQEGHWISRAYDSLRIRFDIRTQSTRLEDCRYLQDTQWSTKEQIYGLIDDAETLDMVKKEFRFLEPMSRSTSFLDKQYASAWTWNYTPKQGDWDYIDTIEGRYRLIDHHEMRDIMETALVDLTNPDNVVLTTDMPAEQIQSLMSIYPNMVRYEYPRKVFYHMIACPAIQKVLVDEPYPIQTGMYAFKPRVCYDIVPQLKEATSVFDNLRDINDSINKRKSTMLEYIMLTVGGNWIGREDSFVNIEDYENNEQGVVLKYKKNTEAPTRVKAGTLPAGLESWEQEDRDALQVVSSVTPNLKGFKESANESGALANTKIKQAEIVFSLLFNNTEIAQKMDAMSCIKHIQQGMTLPRKIRVLNPDGDPEWLQLNWETLNGKINDVTFGEYDIEIDSTRPSITSQQLAFYELSDLMKTMPPEMTMILLDKYIMASDIPDKMIIVKRVRNLMKKQFGFDPDNPDQILPQQGQQQPQGQPSPAGAVTQGAQQQFPDPMQAMFTRAGIS